ncbi:MAG: DM13 domain-containing protein [Acidimicrobiia bacterium]
MLDWIRRNPNITMMGAIVGVALLVFAFVWFEPHKAFIDERVDETIPRAATVTPTTSVPSTTPESSAATTSAPVDETPVVLTTPDPVVTYPVLLSESTLIDVAHGGSGTVLVLELEDGSRVLRFENLDVLNGPDLVVILSDRSLSGADDYTDGEYLILGELKGNIGNQNYEIPADIDLSEWVTAAIWCRRFNTTFNVASITA